MSLLLLIAFVFLVFFLGEQAGRAAPERTKQVREIVEQEAKLKSLKTQLHASSTPPWLYLVGLLMIVYIMAKLLGMGHPDDAYQYFRHRH